MHPTCGPSLWCAIFVCRKNAEPVQIMWQLFNEGKEVYPGCSDEEVAL